VEIFKNGSHTGNVQKLQISFFLILLFCSQKPRREQKGQGKWSPEFFVDVFPEAKLVGHK
jgi:hypothetical protein